MELPVGSRLRDLPFADTPSLLAYAVRSWQPRRMPSLLKSQGVKRC